MAKPVQVYPVFDPSARTLDFSGTANFTLRHLYGVANARTGQMIFSPIIPELKPASISGAVITLSFDTSGMFAADPLAVTYEDGSPDLPTTPKVYTSGAAGMQLATGSGGLRGYDLFNLASVGRVVSFYDAAAQPSSGAAPLVRIVLGAGRARSLTLPGAGAAFTAGLWAAVTAIGSTPAPDPGDVLGTLFL